MNHQILEGRDGKFLLQTTVRTVDDACPNFLWRVFCSYLAPYQRRSNRRNPAGDRELDPPFWLCWGPTQRRAAGTNHRDARAAIFSRAWGGNYKTCNLNKMRENHCKNMQKWDDFHTLTTLDIHLVMGPYHCIIDENNLKAKRMGEAEKPAIFT